MLNVAKANDRKRSDLIRITAAEKRLQPAIIEKDL